MADFVVTGASGFIGKAVCDLLARSGHRVFAVSRRLEALSSAPERASCVHLAGSSVPAEVESDPQAHAQAAETLTKKILDLRFRKVVYASSAAVYGDRAEQPRTENSPVDPRSAYARLKLAQEAAFLASGHVVARLSNVYGPGMSRENVLSRILDQLRQSGRVKLRELVSVRDYLFVSDAARALADLASSDLQGVYNVSTGKGTRVDELVSLMARLEGRTIALASETAGAPSTLVLEPRKIAEDLGWRAAVSLEEGLASLLSKVR